jgi:hypothetical protein
MKALYIGSALALLGGPAAHTETILDVFMGSDARVKVEDCGSDTAADRKHDHHSDHHRRTSVVGRNIAFRVRSAKNQGCGRMALKVAGKR